MLIPAVAGSVVLKKLYDRLRAMLELSEPDPSAAEDQPPNPDMDLFEMIQEIGRKKGYGGIIENPLATTPGDWPLPNSKYGEAGYAQAKRPVSAGRISWGSGGRPFRGLRNDERTAVNIAPEFGFEENKIAQFDPKTAPDPYADLLGTLRRQLEMEVATNFGEIPGYAGSGAGGRERAGALASILAAMQGAKKSNVEAEQDPLGAAKLQLKGQMYAADRSAGAARETASTKGQYDTLVQELKNRGDIDSTQAEFMGDWMMQNKPPDPAQRPDEFAQWMLQFALQLKLMKRGLAGGISAETEAPPLG